MNKGVLSGAKAYVKNGKFTAGALNRIEAVIRTFDRALAAPRTPSGRCRWFLTLVNADGEVVDARPLTGGAIMSPSPARCSSSPAATRCAAMTALGCSLSGLATLPVRNQRSRRIPSAMDSRAGRRDRARRVRALY